MLLFACYGLYLFSANKDSIKDIPISKKMASDKRYDGLDIINIDAYSYKDSNNLDFKVINNSNSDYKEKVAFIVFLDVKNKKIHKQHIVIPEIKAGEEGYFSVSLKRSVFDADTFVISDE